MLSDNNKLLELMFCRVKMAGDTIRTVKLELQMFKDDPTAICEYFLNLY